MNEKEELRQAKEHLRLSMQIVRRDLKVYHKAVLNRNKAVLKNVGNDIIGLFNSFSEKANLAKLEKQKKKLAKEQEELQEEIRKSVERIQKQAEAQRIEEEKKAKREQRRLNVRNGVKQRVSSITSKFGSIKNSILKGLSLSNIDSKIRAAFESIELFGIKTANGVMKNANVIKNNVTNFTSEQLAKYYLFKQRRQEVREERDRQQRVKDAERRETINEMERIKARTEDHKKGMMEAFAERDQYDVQNDIAKSVQSIMEEKQKNKKTFLGRKLNFKPQTKQKAKASSSKLGKVNNSLLFNLRLTNIDAKLRNAFDNVQLFGINIANSAMRSFNSAKESFNDTKENISNFTSEQIAKYSEWRLNKRAERERAARISDAEKLSERMIEERTRDHKIGMMEALNAQEREQYDAKHEEFLKQRQELIQSLIAEKNKLLGKQVIAPEYVEEEPRSKSRYV